MNAYMIVIAALFCMIYTAGAGIINEFLTAFFEDINKSKRLGTSDVMQIAILTLIWPVPAVFILGIFIYVVLKKKYSKDENGEMNEHRDKRASGKTKHS